MRLPSPEPRMPSDSPEIHPVHTRHGPHWLELILSVAALFTSGVSVFIAVQHGKVMEKMLQASSLPFVTVYSGDYVDGAFVAHLTLRNEGVGPARLQSFRVELDGKKLHNMQDFIDVCCDKQFPSHGLSTSNAYERFIPARGESEIFEYHRQGDADPLWSKFDQARARLHFDICYCSVFAECYRWIAFAATARPVASCPVDFTADFVP
jgi:hypothetical protein